MRRPAIPIVVAGLVVLLVTGCGSIGETASTSTGPGTGLRPRTPAGTIEPAAGCFELWAFQGALARASQAENESIGRDEAASVTYETGLAAASVVPALGEDIRTIYADIGRQLGLVEPIPNGTASTGTTARGSAGTVAARTPPAPPVDAGPARARVNEYIDRNCPR